MIEVTHSDFLARCQALRKSATNTADYLNSLKEFDKFEDLVHKIEAKTIRWGKTVGIGKTEEIKPDISEEELKWKNYFRDHSFNSVEDARNVADLIYNLTGVKASRFISEVKETKVRFPAFISIVPIGNTNDHDYTIGEPILSFSTGSQFVRINGTTGNSMSTRTSEYRLSTRSEIELIVASVMLRSPNLIESLIVNVLMARIRDE